MFISDKEKFLIHADIAYLRKIIDELSVRVFQLEGRPPVQKKRGRPVGSKNKEKK